MSVRCPASSAESIPFLRTSSTNLRIAESRTLMVEAESASIEARYSIATARVSGRPAANDTLASGPAPQNSGQMPCAGLAEAQQGLRRMVLDTLPSANSRPELR